MLGGKPAPVGMLSEVLPEVSASREIVAPELKLNKGDNEVAIVSGLNPIQPHAKDPRLLSHSFTAVEIEEL